MTPTYNQNSSPPPFPLDDQYNTPKPQASSSSSLSSYVFTYPIQDQGGFYHRELHQLDSQEETNFALRGGSNDHQTTESESDHGLKLSLPKEDGSGDQNQSDEKNSFERMPAKKRLIMRMMKSASNRGVVDGSLTNAQLIKFEDHQKLQASTNSSSLESTENGSNSSSSNSNNLIRVCSDCNTTKTPLWRSGPNGPKSLCNACGIRQRKARRAMAAATAAAANGTILAAETSPTKTCKLQQHKAKRPNNGHIIKKKSKITAAAAAAASHGKKKKVCFEEFLISLSKNLAFHRVFPQDEKEAAILLMALSCGLVHG